MARVKNAKRVAIKETMNLGARIAFLRTSANLTQTDLAKRCGTYPAQISIWEKGDVEPGATVIVLIANVFGITPGQLLGLEEITRADLFDLWLRF